MHHAENDNHRHASNHEHHSHRGSRHHHSKHHHHAHHRRDSHEHETDTDDAALYDYYGELEQKEGLNLLINLLKTLKKNGQVSLSDHQMSITDDIGFSITHAETWDGTEKLTLALEWSPEHDDSSWTEEEEEQVAPTIS